MLKVIGTFMDKSKKITRKEAIEISRRNSQRIESLFAEEVSCDDVIDLYDTILLESNQKLKALEKLLSEVSLERDKALAKKERAHEALRKAEQNELKALADLDEALHTLRELYLQASVYWEDEDSVYLEMILKDAKKLIEDLP